MDHERIADIRKRWSQYKVPPQVRSDMHALLSALVSRDERIAELQLELKLAKQPTT